MSKEKNMDHEKVLQQLKASLHEQFQQTAKKLEGSLSSHLENLLKTEQQSMEELVDELLQQQIKNLESHYLDRLKAELHTTLGEQFSPNLMDNVFSQARGNAGYHVAPSSHVPTVSVSQPANNQGPGLTHSFSQLSNNLTEILEKGRRYL